MNVYQDIIFRSLDKLRGRNTIKRLYGLRKSQFWNKEQLINWQINKLNNLLGLAVRNSQFYKERFKGMEITLSSIDQLQKLPVLTKKHIRKNLETIRCYNIPKSKVELSRTGGSTGEPTYYYLDSWGKDFNRASVYRAAEWANTALGEMTFQMSGSHFDDTNSRKLFNKLVSWVQRYKDLPTSYLTEDLMHEYYKKLLKYKPTGIWGYASGISHFAAYLKKKYPNESFNFVKGIITSSETLWPEQRKIINQVFGSNKVFDNYGSRELYIASECNQHNGYHIHSETIVLEVVNHENQWCEKGETGRILVTDLSNRAFPFIRYEIGDLGAWGGFEECSCGITLPKLKKIVGRVADVVVLKDRILTAPNFTILLSDNKGIKNFQVIQEKIDEIKILIVPDENYQDGIESYIDKSINKMVEGQATIIIQKVNKIEIPESGKRRFIISSISQNRF